MADAPSTFAPAHAFDDSRLGEALRRLAAGRTEDVAEASRQLHAAAGQGVAEAWSWLATPQGRRLSALPRTGSSPSIISSLRPSAGAPRRRVSSKLMADEASDAKAGDWAALRRSVSR